jgi:hypothetical protein
MQPAVCEEPGIKTEPAVEAPALSEADMPWVWAEVQSIDRANNQITVKYLDYETDTEKEMVIGVDEKTAFENAKSLNDIKPQDTVSIDYISGADGINTARTINVEKGEGTTGADDSAKLPPPDDLKPDLGGGDMQEAGQE